MKINQPGHLAIKPSEVLPRISRTMVVDYN